VRYGDADAVDEYGPRALARVWKAQHFSYWMTSMLHALPGATDFDLRCQLGELESAANSVASSSMCWCSPCVGKGEQVKAAITWSGQPGGSHMEGS